MSTDNKKLLLIDGHSIINRAFYGVPDLTCSEGLHTNAIYGFLNIFFNVYSKTGPNYVIVAFDVKEKTFRHKMYTEYKGGRRPMPAELNEQVPVLKEVLHSMHIMTAELPGYEADDVIGTYAKMAEDDGLAVIILSGDRDLLQLATESTMIAVPKTKSGGSEVETYYANDVLKRYNVTPSEFVDLKALMGDQSDNIPGVPGIGEKTASAIISRFKSIECAFEHVDEITPNRARESLKNNYELAVLSKTLSAINTSSPVAADYHEGAVPDEKIFYNSDSYAMFKRLELNRLLSRFDSEALNQVSEPGIEYINVDFRGLKEIVSNAGRGALGLYVSRDIRCVGISVSADMSGEAYNSAVCAFMNYICFDEKGLLKADLRELIIKLLHSEHSICVFDLKGLLHILSADDFYSDNILDIKIMAYLMNPILSSYTFDSVSKDWLNKIIPSEIDLTGKKGENASSDNLSLLAALSSETALAASHPLYKALENKGMERLLKEVELPLIYTLYGMEKNGIKVNKAALSDFSGLLSDMISSLESDIFAEAGENFNINSPKQLGTILFEKLSLPHGKKTKTGYSTSADVLENLAREHLIVRNILKYRQAAKLKSTYADGLTEYISDDGRIHGTFNQTITATGRISSTEPNLQNIPVRTELGQEVRRAFVPEKGCIFLDADYSQIELRVLAHMSNDENLIAAYGTDADIHKITAAKVFNIPLDEVTKEQRRSAKAVNFGIVYGISSFGLSQDLSITRKQADEYIRQYFATYPQVKEFLDNTVREAKINGYTTSLFGRIRPIPELSSGNFMQRAFGERAAMNSPIQGTAADIMKIAMVNVDKALKAAKLRARIVLQVHDELLVEAPQEEAVRVREILISEMKNAANLKVSLEVDVNSANDWFSAH